ncbi:hypothetical protein [Nocardioides sp. GY 10113]|uniref:RCC1 domain-containing protein n=1 Tax=Nocardioides sp. GY 10113 TaxID=2569761 RepID=UPI00145827B9|nr:hypothetical protein [Nocardioides sp. GY 10113]
MTTTGAVRCWGFGDTGALGYGDSQAVGDGTTTGMETPAAAGDVPLGGRAVAITAGEDHTCALLTTDAVRCWGIGADGRLGYGDTSGVGAGSVGNETPADAGDVPLGGKAVAIAAGGAHTCALMATGAVRCWGRANSGQLGYGDAADVGGGTTPGKETPADAGDVPLGGRAVAITAGDVHTCALMATGAVRCWGYGGLAELGYGDTDTVGDGSAPGKETPADAGDVPLGGKAVAITAGAGHTCALMATGAVRCWGTGSFGRLGYGNTDTVGDGSVPGKETPADAGDVPLGGTAVAITASRLHSCALMSAGGVRCWGAGGSGRLGYGDPVEIGAGLTVPPGRATPGDAGDLPLGGTAVAVAAGGVHTCATLTTGALRCWGFGTAGRLGYGDGDSVGDGTVGGKETPAAAGDVPVGAAVRVRAAVRLSVQRQPRRDRKPPYVYRVKGSLAGAFAVDPATCAGTVTVRAIKGKRQLAKVTVPVRDGCGFVAKVRITKRALPVRKKTRVTLTVIHPQTRNLGGARKALKVFVR